METWKSCFFKAVFVSADVRRLSNITEPPCLWVGFERGWKSAHRWKDDKIKIVTWSWIFQGARSGWKAGWRVWGRAENREGREEHRSAVWKGWQGIERRGAGEGGGGGGGGDEEESSGVLLFPCHLTNQLKGRAEINRLIVTKQWAGVWKQEPKQLWSKGHENKRVKSNEKKKEFGQNFS